MTTWSIDPSEPRISPERFLTYYGELQGLSRDDLALPPVLVGTFQRLAFQHMAAQIGQPEAGRWPSPIHWPLSRGTFEGKELSVTRLPFGAPAAAMALELMLAAGVKTVFLVGSAGSLQPALPTGSLVVATGAVRQEGTSHHYVQAGEPASASAELVDALISVALERTKERPRQGPVWTTDAPYRECADTVSRLAASGVLAVEMEAAALFAVARHRSARAALVVAISDELHGEWKPGFLSMAYRRALLEAADIALHAASRD